MRDGRPDHPRLLTVSLRARIAGGVSRGSGGDGGLRPSNALWSPLAAGLGSTVGRPPFGGSGMDTVDGSACFPGETTSLIDVGTGTDVTSGVRPRRPRGARTTGSATVRFRGPGDGVSACRVCWAYAPGVESDPGAGVASGRPLSGSWTCVTPNRVPLRAVRAPLADPAQRAARPRPAGPWE